jgi:hypothetical protein
MTRAIEEIETSAMVGRGTAFFFMYLFDKSSDTSSRSVENCLQALLRQVSWDANKMAVEDATEGFHEGIKTSQNTEGEMTMRDCMGLLKGCVHYA